MAEIRNRPKTAVTIYLSKPIYEQLVMRKARGHGPLTEQVERYCAEGLARDQATSDDRPASLPTPTGGPVPAQD